MAFALAGLACLGGVAWAEPVLPPLGPIPMVVGCAGKVAGGGNPDCLSALAVVPNDVAVDQVSPFLMDDGRKDTCGHTTHEQSGGCHRTFASTTHTDALLLVRCDSSCSDVDRTNGVNHIHGASNDDNVQPVGWWLDFIDGAPKGCHEAFGNDWYLDGYRAGLSSEESPYCLQVDASGYWAGGVHFA